MQRAQTFAGRCAAILLLCAAVPISNSAARAQVTRFSTDVNVVNVLANVFDPKGALIQNLAKTDFVLEEDGRPQIIRYFAQQTELPLTLGLLIDTSGSMSRMIEEERTASSAFFKQVIRPKQDQVFVMDFDAQVRVVQNLTSSRKRLDSALSRVDPFQWRVPVRTSGAAFSPDGRTTALFDAIYLASEAVMRKQTGRKALIIMSDGMDINSEYKLDDAIAAAQRSDTLIYAVHIYDSWTPALTVPLSPPPDLNAASTASASSPMKKAEDDALRQGKDALKRAARETGGTYFEFSDEGSVSKIYQRIEDELRSQYNLGYSPDHTHPAAGFHKIRLSTTRAGFTVQAREGYYAEK